MDVWICQIRSEAPVSDMKSTCDIDTSLRPIDHDINAYLLQIKEVECSLLHGTWPETLEYIKEQIYNIIQHGLNASAHG